MFTDDRRRWIERARVEKELDVCPPAARKRDEPFPWIACEPAEQVDGSVRPWRLERRRELHCRDDEQRRDAERRSNAPRRDPLGEQENETGH